MRQLTVGRFFVGRQGMAWVYFGFEVQFLGIPTSKDKFRLEHTFSGRFSQYKAVSTLS